MAKSRVLDTLIPTLDELSKIFDTPLNIIETGTIRRSEPEYAVGDGHSTKWIARWIAKNGGTFYSVDLETATAYEFLAAKELLKYVKLVKSSSIAFLEKIDFDVHLAYLDSANDPVLTKAEFLAVLPHMATGGRIIVDDYVPDSREKMKGNLLHPYLVAYKFKFEIKGVQCIIYL